MKQAMLSGLFLAMSLAVAHGQDGTAGYWKLDETSGNEAADSSGNGQDGAHLGSPVISVDLAPVSFPNVRSLQLDGVEDYVRIPRSTLLEPTAVTISLWVKRNGAQVTWANIFRKTGQNNTGPTSYALQIRPDPPGNDSSIVAFVTGHAGTPNADVLNSIPSVVPDGVWVHIAATFNPQGPAPQKKLYVNGSLVASKTLTSPIVYDSTPTGDLYVGQNGALGEFFKGTVDDIRFYGQALSSADVSSLAGGTTTQIGRFAFWDRDNANGNHSMNDTLCTSAIGGGFSLFGTGGLLIAVLALGWTGVCKRNLLARPASTVRSR